jgi:hypothetical protein
MRHVSLRFAFALIVAACGATAASGVRLHAAEPCAIDGIDRIVAIGDVHGAFDRLTAILRTAGLVDAQLRWSGGRTHLVQTGDVVDRGPDSRKALDLLKALAPQARQAGGRVHALLGNHEVMRMLGDWRDVAPGEYAAFVNDASKQLRDRLAKGVKDDAERARLQQAPLGSLEMSAAFGPNGDYGEWLRTLDAVVRLNGVVFVHGGISPAIADRSCTDINDTVRRELGRDLDKTRAAPLESLAAREDGPFWYRGLAQEPEPTFGATVDDILARQRATAIVVGHTVVSTGRIGIRFRGKVIQIDTGMQPAYVTGGRASALDIRNGTVTAIYEDRRDALPVATWRDAAAPALQ